MNAALALPAIETATDVCRHCGDPCGGPSAGSPVRTAGEVFCCAGCASVYTLLQERGLDGFYTCDVAPGVSQRNAAAREPSRFAALDDPEVAARLVTFDDGALAGVTFTVPDLHCASCLWLLERLWRVDEGIVRADADLTRRTVHVWFRPDRVSLRGVAERLAAIGYEPVIAVEGRPAGMPAARRSLYLKLAVAGFAFGNIMLFSIPRYVNGAPLEGGFQRLFDVVNVVLALPVLLYSASGYFVSAWRAIRTRHLILDVPVALGLAVLFSRSLFDIVTSRSEGFMDSFTGLVFFLLIGRLFQQKAFDRIAFDRSFRSFLPLSVHVERERGLVTLPLDRVHAGDRIAVRPHEIVPADARLLDAEGAVDYAFVTGESAPVQLQRDATVRAGGRIVGRTLRLEVLQEVSHSRLASLWRNPAFAKAKTRGLADLSASFGVWFTIVAIALAAAGAVAWWPDAAMSAQVATAVLIIACPCALTLAAPITLGTAMEMLGRHGLYLKDAAVALDLARADALVFDKTGTLTHTSSNGVTVEHSGLTDEEWRLARRLAAESVHPVSRAIAAAASTPALGEVTDCLELPGRHLSGRVDGHDVILGRPPAVAIDDATAAADRASASAAATQRSRATATAVVPTDNTIAPPVDGTIVTIDGRIRGSIRVRHADRPGVAHAVQTLAATHDVSLLSGDRAGDRERWRPIFGDGMSFHQSPEDKLAAITTRQSAGHVVVMIGDGLNDAGALAAADVGIAVSDDTACMVPACDAVIDGDRLARLPGFLRYAKRARRTIVVCFAVSLVYNAIGLSLALAGLLTPLATAVLMPVSSLTIIGLSIGRMRWFARGLGRS